MCKINEFGTAIILAGGKSSRMGFDKQFLKIKEIRLMEIIIDKLKEEFEEIIIVTNKPDEYNEFQYKIVSVIIKEKGPLSGLQVGLKNATSTYSYFIACDMPSVNLDYIRYMKEKIRETSPKACVTKDEDGHIEVFNGFYSKELYENIKSQLSEDKRAVNALLKSVDTLYISSTKAKVYSPDYAMFKNLNTKEELENYISQIKDE